MNKFILLLTWLIMELCKPILPKSHPWKHRSFTLTEWAEGATPLCREFGVVMWISAISLAALLEILTSQ